MDEDIVFSAMDSFIAQYQKVALDNATGLVTMKKYRVIDEKEYDLLINFNVLCIGALEKIAGQNRKIS